MPRFVLFDALQMEDITESYDEGGSFDSVAEWRGQSGNIGTM